MTARLRGKGLAKQPKHEVFRVGVTGSYGGINLGDEAILQVILGQLSRSLPVEITVFSRNASDTLARHHVDRAVPVRELSRTEVTPEIERLDLLILGGGGILFDSEAGTFLREVMLAHEHGVPVMVYAIGAGPLTQSEVQRQVRACLNRSRAITVRERQAHQALEDAGVRSEIKITADPAFLLEPEPLPVDALTREGLDGRRRLIGVSVRELGPAAPDMDQNQYHGLLADAADYMIDRMDADLVFVPIERSDVQHSHGVISRMAYASRATVLKGEYTPGQVLSLVGHFEFAVGMRLHFLIFAALQHVAFVALPYAAKVKGLLESFEMAMPPMQQVTSGRLIAHIDRSWDLRRDLQARIERALPPLRERARETVEIAVRLLTENEAARLAKVPR